LEEYLLRPEVVVDWKARVPEAGSQAGRYLLLTTSSSPGYLELSESCISEYTGATLPSRLTEIDGTGKKTRDRLPSAIEVAQSIPTPHGMNETSSHSFKRRSDNTGSSKEEDPGKGLKMTLRFEPPSRVPQRMLCHTVHLFILPWKLQQSLELCLEHSLAWLAATLVCSWLGEDLGPHASDTSLGSLPAPFLT